MLVVSRVSQGLSCHHGYGLPVYAVTERAFQTIRDLHWHNEHFIRGLHVYICFCVWSDSVLELRVEV